MHVFLQSLNLHIEGTLLLQCMVSFIVVRLLDKQPLSIQRVVYSMISPPLFPDWEDIYRSNHAEVSLALSFKLSLGSFIVSVFGFATQHLLFCTPLLMLRNIALERQAMLADNYFSNIARGASVYLDDRLPTLWQRLPFPLPCASHGNCPNAGLLQIWTRMVTCVGQMLSACFTF